MLGFACLFRLLGIFAFPVLENDFYRYLWDGRMLVEHGTPYLQAPVEFFDAVLPERFEDILGQINYPEVATVYGPLNQWLFALGYLIAPGQVWPLQLMFSLADIGLILLLTRLTSVNNVLLYAWCPLVVKEFAFTAHPDVLGAMLLVGAVWLVQQKSLLKAAVLLALSAGVKIFALLAVPFLLRFNLKAWAVFALVALFISLPFGVLPAWLPEGLTTMGNSWLFNAPLYVALLNRLDLSLLKLILLSLFVMVWLVYFARFILSQEQHIPLMDRVYGLFFLCTPVFNPWYLVWLLPFAAIRPSYAAWTASVTVLLSYASGINLPDSEWGLYDVPPVILALEFALIGAALILDFMRCKSCQSDKAG